MPNDKKIIFTIGLNMYSGHNQLPLNWFTGICLFFMTIIPIHDSRALSHDEIVVVVNTRMVGSEDLAHHYMKLRKISEDNLVKTSLVLTETMTRTEYEGSLLTPLITRIETLEKQGKHIYGVVLIYGVPLKVLQPQLTWDEEELLDSLKESKEIILIEQSGDKVQKSDREKLSEQIRNISGINKRAAVDSELALARVKKYPLEGWIPNPYFIGFKKLEHKFKKDEVLLVSRLDGPDLKTVYRMIDDSIQVEKRGGLDGIAYFDARWKIPDDETKSSNGYAFYDKSLHKAAETVRERMPVVINESEELFQPGQAPDAALYAGWYSLGNYIDAFEWNRGAVGFHIASSECSTLRKGDTKVWCPNMLRDGVAATIGPVYEPYVTGFPLPELFFSALTEGYMNLGESYLISLPYISWQMVLVGDPLYRPFHPLNDK